MGEKFLLTNNKSRPEGRLKGFIMNNYIPSKEEQALFREQQKIMNPPEIRAMMEAQSASKQKPLYAMGEAEAFCKVLEDQMIDFQNTLNSEQDLGLQLTNYGKEIQISVTDIGYIGQNLICYTGFIDDNKCRLIQHTSQVNFLLIAVPKPSSRPATRIGF